MSDHRYRHPPQFAGRYEGCVLDSEGNCSRWNHDHPPAVAAETDDKANRDHDGWHDLMQPGDDCGGAPDWCLAPNGVECAQHDENGDRRAANEAEVAE